jgi:competence protein ComEA
VDLPRNTWIWAAGLLLVAVLGTRHLGREAAAPRAAAPPPIAMSCGEGETGGRVLVHVAGAVRDPGVYRLRAGSRVDDAVRRAGGATARADLTAVNLAAEVEDGRQVVVPERPRHGGAAPAAVAGPGAATAPGAPINLNTATLEQLDSLEGIGPGTAQKILEARTARGGFSSVDELAQIPGIGEKRLAAIRARVTL